jgi:hypothetical protein
VLTETNLGCLANSGEIQFHPAGDDPSSDLISRWTLSWPAQREARSRNEGEQVAPIQVIAKMGRTALHGHVSGARAGDWPLQITNSDEAEAQEQLVRLIVEAELHQRIFDTDGYWRIVTAYAELEGS